VQSFTAFVLDPLRLLGARKRHKASLDPLEAPSRCKPKR
jgi:hypothetical protein